MPPESRKAVSVIPDSAGGSAIRASLRERVQVRFSGRESGFGGEVTLASGWPTFWRLAAAGVSEATSRLFSEMGEASGREKIKRFFAAAPPIISYARHYIVAPVIDVDAAGDTATGSWYLIQPATLRGRPVWLAGHYEDEYVKQDGRWLFRRVRVLLDFMTPHDVGWVQQQFVEFG